MNILTALLFALTVAAVPALAADPLVKTDSVVGKG